MKHPNWVRSYRRPDGLIVNVCVHGEEHPVFGSAHFQKCVGIPDAGVHKCRCKCCTDPEWQLADARKGVKIANHIIIGQQTKIRALMTAIDELQQLSLKRKTTDRSARELSRLKAAALNALNWVSPTTVAYRRLYSAVHHRLPKELEKIRVQPLMSLLNRKGRK